MVKAKITYACNACGATHLGWSGKCTVCGEWNTITETVNESKTVSAAGKTISKGKNLHYATISRNQPEKRLSVGIKDIDLVLGGGIVRGGVVLIAGEPGIGKSTLLMQLAYNSAQAGRVLYISGEESENQVSWRAKRLGAVHDNLFIASSTSANDIARTIEKEKFDLVVVDYLNPSGRRNS